ncbi:MAG TPA: hypothetical protein VIK40_08655 [Geomonas sp.]
MEQRQKQISKLRRPFVISGAAVGASLTCWYLYNNFGRVTLVPDPIWTRFVNIALIMFSSIYVANLLRLLVEFIMRRKGHS